MKPKEEKRMLGKLPPDLLLQGVLRYSGAERDDVANYEKTNDKPVGTVVRQDPALGIDTKLGSSVNIWIAVPETNNNPNPPENSENQGAGNNTGTGNNG